MKIGGRKEGAKEREGNREELILYNFILRIKCIYKVQNMHDTCEMAVQKHHMWNIEFLVEIIKRIMLPTLF